MTWFIFIPELLEKSNCQCNWRKFFDYLLVPWFHRLPPQLGLLRLQGLNPAPKSNFTLVILFCFWRGIQTSLSLQSESMHLFRAQSRLGTECGFAQSHRGYRTKKLHGWQNEVKNGIDTFQTTLWQLLMSQLHNGRLRNWFKWTAAKEQLLCKDDCHAWIPLPFFLSSSPPSSSLPASRGNVSTFFFSMASPPLSLPAWDKRL